MNETIDVLEIATKEEIIKAIIEKADFIEPYEELHIENTQITTILNPWKERTTLNFKAFNNKYTIIITPIGKMEGEEE